MWSLIIIISPTLKSWQRPPDAFVTIIISTPISLKIRTGNVTWREAPTISLYFHQNQNTVFIQQFKVSPRVFSNTKMCTLFGVIQSWELCIKLMGFYPNHAYFTVKAYSTCRQFSSYYHNLNSFIHLQELFYPGQGSGASPSNTGRRAGEFAPDGKWVSITGHQAHIHIHTLIHTRWQFSQYTYLHVHKQWE